MAAYKLLLHPIDPEFSQTGVADVRAALENVGLIGEQRDDDEGGYFAVGEHFLDLIAFLGCSPAIQLEPPSELGAHQGSDSFCHVRISAIYESPQFRHGRNPFAPRCRQCKRAEADWPRIVQARATDPDGYRWQCPGCGTLTRPEHLNWRQSAGWGRIFVEIWNVHPQEAVPGDTLLDALHKATGVRWSFFYAWD